MIDQLPTGDAFTTRESTARRMYWPELDGLRFLAALLVFIAHAPILPLPFLKELNRFGWSGVDLFLVLSAFLLTRLLKAEYEGNGSIGVMHFYVRRMLRIWPLHWGFVSLMLLGQLSQNIRGLREAIGFWLSHLLFINNIVVSSVGFERRLPFTTHLWTISLEEQFYIVIPLIVRSLLGRRWNTKDGWAAVGIGIVLLMGMRACCVLLQMPHPFVWVLPLRADSILLGLFLGLTTFNGGLAGVRGIMCFAVGCVVLGVAACLPSLEAPGWPQVVGYTVVDSGCALLVVGVLEKNFIGDFLALPMFRYLGKISFGLYVYHGLALAIGKRVAVGFSHSGVIVFVVGFVLTVGFASVSYQLFERRFLVLKERFSFVKSRPI